MSGLPELQDAVRQIPGIASASIRWPDPLGPASLRVEFKGDVDHHEVGEAVIRTLVDIGEVDLTTLRLEREDRPSWSTRPIFTTLVLDRLGPDLTVEVGLSIGGHDVSGLAQAHGSDDALATVAYATVEALLRVDGTQPYEIRHVQRTAVAGTDLIHVVVDLPDGDPATGPLIGTAVVSHDAREATVRATLDAVNRHFEMGRRSDAAVDLTGA